MARSRSRSRSRSPSIDTGVYSDDAIERALSIGVLMGEESNLVGMALVAASGLNRGTRPGAFAAKTANLGDIFSAPHAGRTMAQAVANNRQPKNTKTARQYSTTLNIPQTRDAYKAFRSGMLAELGIRKDLGPYAGRYQKATFAFDVTTQAKQKLGLDLGWGVTNYGTLAKGKDKVAGVGSNKAVFGYHGLGPFPADETPPNAKEMAANFAAAAALLGYDIPADMQRDVSRYAQPADIAAAIPAMQRAVVDATGTFPGVTYSDTVNKTGLGAVDVEDFSRNLGIDPVNAPWAEMGGATPYAPPPVDPMTVQPRAMPFDNFEGILGNGALPEREPPATFDERYAPSGPPATQGDFSAYMSDLLGGGTPTPELDRQFGYDGSAPGSPVHLTEQPASAGFFNDRYEGDGLPMGSAAYGRPIGDWEFGSQTAPMVGPASMAYGLDFETAPDPFAPEPAPDWFSDRVAEPSLYGGSSFGLDTAMSGSRTTPMAGPARLGSEITPEFTPHVPEWAQAALDQMPDYDHLGAPPMGGYTPPAPPQDYTAPPSLLAGMNIGGAVADRLNTPTGYDGDYMTPGYARDPMEAARGQLAQSMAERFGVSAGAATPSKPRFEPEPIQRFTERTVYDTKVVPETVQGFRDVPVEQSFSKSNVSKGLGAKPTSFADLGFSMTPMTSDTWSTALNEKAKAVTQQPQQAAPPTRREPYSYTRNKTVSTPRIERTPIPTPMRAPMVTPELPSFARATPQAGFGITPVGPSGWLGAGSFQSAPSLSQSFAMAGNSLFGGLSDSLLSALGYGPGSSFTGGWGGLGSGPGGSGQAWGDGGPGGYGGGSVYDGNSGPYAGGDARFDGGWGGVSDGDTYR
jgi:hypothetical protein